MFVHCITSEEAIYPRKYSHISTYIKPLLLLIMWDCSKYYIIR